MTPLRNMRLLLADIDGTLVTPGKVLTVASIAASVRCAKRALRSPSPAADRRAT
jgi:hypothetical protein